MAKPTRNKFSIRPHHAEGYWLSDDRRYFEYAHLQLTELEEVTEQVKQQWPAPLNQTLRNHEHTPELGALVRKRDLLSDSVKVFSAMAVEGFLNYYGVVRLGEAEYAAHFERLGLIPKLRALLLICDSLSVSEADPLVKTLNRIAQRRNALVHAKARELPDYVPGEERGGDKIPEVARETVKDMEAFFREFVKAVPEAAHLIPPLPATHA